MREISRTRNGEGTPLYRQLAGLSRVTVLTGQTLRTRWRRLSGEYMVQDEPLEIRRRDRPCIQ